MISPCPIEIENEEEVKFEIGTGEDLHSWKIGSVQAAILAE